MLIFWVVKPCGLVGRYQRFGGTYCLHLQRWNHFSPKDRDSMFLRNVGIYLQALTALQPRTTTTCSKRTFHATENFPYPFWILRNLQTAVDLWRRQMILDTPFPVQKKRHQECEIKAQSNLFEGRKHNGPPRTSAWYVYTWMLLYVNVKHVLTFVSLKVNWKENGPNYRCLLFRPDTSVTGYIFVQRQTKSQVIWMLSNTLRRHLGGKATCRWLPSEILRRVVW
jgi:hypothetical protein